MQISHTTTKTTTLKPDLKMGKGREFFQRRHTDSQQTNEKMLNITNHQGNTNQNHNKILPCTCQNDCHQKTTNNKCW